MAMATLVKVYTAVSAAGLGGYFFYKTFLRTRKYLLQKATPNSDFKLVTTKN